MSKPKIKVLVGMIASGKSTYSNKQAQGGAIIINDDAIVTAVHGGDYTLYSTDLKLLYKSVENHILHLAVAMGRDVVIDRGLSLTVNSRSRWISLARSLDLESEAVVFKVEEPEEHARRRIDHSSRGHNYSYWLDVAKHHASIYEPVTKKEGFYTITNIDYDNYFTVTKNQL